MTDANVVELIDRIERELEATIYALQSIELALSSERNTGTDSIVETNLSNGALRDWQHLGNSLVESQLELNYPIARGAANRMSAMLVGTVCEILDPQEGVIWNQKTLYDYEEMQFLRWVRNGVFHGNRFVFDSYDGSGAVWRGCELTLDMQGDVVFTEIEGIRLTSAPPESPNDLSATRDINEGLLEAGDGLELVSDITDILYKKQSG